jgi:hypothetical protein
MQRRTTTLIHARLSDLHHVNIADTLLYYNVAHVRFATNLIGETGPMFGD